MTFESSFKELTNNVALSALFKNDDRFSQGILNRWDPRCMSNICGEKRSYYYSNSPHYRSCVRRILKILFYKLMKHKWKDVAILSLTVTHDAIFKLRFNQDGSTCDDLNEILWRMVNQLYFYHSHDRGDTLLANKQSSSFAYMDQIRVLLEYAFSEMLRGRLMEAKNELKLFFTIPKKHTNVNKRNYLKECLKRLHSTVQGYLGMIDYVGWLKGIYGNELVDEDHEQKVVEEVLNSFRDLMSEPENCWDIFAIKLVSMLEHYELNDMALSDLFGYSTTHQINPNAQILYYNCLKKQDESSYQQDKEKLDCLRRLQKLDPSNEACIDLHMLLHKDWFHSNDKKVGVECFEVIMCLLDHGCWTEEKHPWEVLYSSLSSSNNAGKNQLVIIAKEVWIDSGRSYWWPVFHESSDKKMSLIKNKVFRILDLF